MRAVITGITGQDGSYLAELLLEKGYEVYGVVRRASTESFERIEHIRDKINLVQADLLDQLSLVNVLEEAKPDEIYNLAAQSFVPTSWTQPLLTGEFDALGVTRLLEAIRLLDKKIHFYQCLGALLAQIFISSALHDPKQELLHPGVRSQRFTGRIRGARFLIYGFF